MQYVKYEKLNIRNIPTVSIGMPVYNGEMWIREALDSLLRQTFTDFELIISNNASNDSTEQICKEYADKDKRIKYFSQIQNQGALFNFNFVLQQAISKYFMWAACDDTWEDTFIYKCIEILDNNDEYGLVFTNYDVISRRMGFVFSKYVFPKFNSFLSGDLFSSIGSYILLDDGCHKANFIYGIWRIDLARNVTECFAQTPEELVYSGCDIAMLTYTLSKTKLYQLPSKLFHKKYRTFVPGTIPALFWSLINDCLKNPVSIFNYKEKLHRVQKHTSLLEYAFSKAEITNTDYEKILFLKKILSIVPLASSFPINSLIVGLLMRWWKLFKYLIPLG